MIDASQLKRDLLWLLHSPPLIDLKGQSPFIHKILDDEGVDGIPGERNALSKGAIAQLAQSLMDSPTRRLGRYYEALSSHLIHHDPRYRVLACNHQIFEGKRTVGEFDQIFALGDGIFHREIAVKLYLGVPHTGGEAPADRWIGPNVQDRLSLKLHRLLSHQSRLSLHPAGAASLQALGIGAVQAQILMQGYLFYPVDGPCDPPEEANPSHLRGHWVRIEDMDWWLRSKGEDLRYIPLPRLQWLSSLSQAMDGAEALDLDGLKAFVIQEFNRFPNPTLIAACNQHGGQWQEAFRFFVVNDWWTQKVGI